jgi:hypothetical protein
VRTAVQNLVQAGVLAIGIAIYSVPWGRVGEWARRTRAGVTGERSADAS